MAGNQHLRASWHDYTSRCIYMITICKSSLTPSFGVTTGQCTKDSARIALSPIGENVKACIGKLSTFNPAIRLLQYIVMPDHIHLLIFVESNSSEHIGYTIARWKTEVDETCGMTVFQQGYNDQILKKSRSLDRLFQYIKENPYLLLVRQRNAEFFTKVNNMTVADVACQAYGNLQLLDNPFKEQVVVHRSDDVATRRRNRSEWLYTAANGGVLVSPFISRDEKEIRAEAEKLGGKIIHVTSRPLAEREKPSGRDFELCAEGRLLILSPVEYQSPNGSGNLSRALCMEMNTFAKQISEN